MKWLRKLFWRKPKKDYSIRVKLSPAEAFFYSENAARVAFDLYRNRGKEVIVHYEDEMGNQRTLGNTLED